MNTISNSRIWLTGASSGIGEALARELCRRGARVAGTARNREALTALAARIGDRFSPYPGDVCDLGAMKEIAARVRTDFGGLDMLIANAGNHLFTIPEKFDSVEYLGLMDLNYGGMVRCIEAVLPQMIESRAGTIVGMASMAGYRGLPRAAAYGASKAAMHHFLESLRFHARRHGVAVTIVSPGFVKTPLTDKNDFKMPFLIDADRAAVIVCDGIERGRSEIAFPRPFNWIMKACRIMPYPLYDRLIERVWRSM